MKKRTTILLLAVFMAAALILSACGGSSTGSGSSPASGAEGTSPTGKDSVSIGVKSEVSTMDPYNNSVTVDRALRANWYETLMVFYGGNFEKVLVEDYSVSDDGLLYTFKIKQGVKYHDGSVMTADDVAYSLEKGLAAPSYATESTYVKEIRVADDTTVEVELKEIYAPFLLSVGTKVCIINKAHMEAKGDQEGYNTPVGTGAYTLAERVIGQKLVCKAFEDWHGGSPAIKTAEFVVIADPTSAQMALESKEIDMTYILPSIAVSAVESDPNFDLQKVTLLGCGYLVYNLESAPFDDVNFRQAIVHAVDRDKIIASALDGNGERSTNLWNSNFIGDSGNISFPEFDLAKAKEYLDKSGYNGETISFTIGNETYKRIAVIMQEDFRSIGINVDVQQVEINTWINDMTKGTYSMAFINENVEADVGMWVYVLSTDGIGVMNMSQLKSAEVDAAFAEAASTNDVAVRQAQYDIIGNYLVDNAVLVPVYYPLMTPAYDVNLNVARIYPADGYARLSDISWK